MKTCLFYNPVCKVRPVFLMILYMGVYINTLLECNLTALSKSLHRNFTQRTFFYPLIFPIDTGKNYRSLKDVENQFSLSTLT